MKLAYQSLGSIEKGYGQSRSMGYPTALRAYLDRVSRDDTEIELFGTEQGGKASPYRFFAKQDTDDVLKNMMRVYRDDHDGYVLGNVYDPGLREGRELLPIPVVGYTETSVLVARLVADEAALVMLHQKGIPHIKDNLRTYGLDDRVFVRGSEIGVDGVARAFEDEDLRSRILNEFLDVARNCIADDAEVIVPGAGIVTMLLNEEGITDVDGIPLMDGISVIVKLAETLVDLYDMNALRTSEQRMYQPPEESFLEELIDDYLEE